jgi:hypothetical protein
MSWMDGSGHIADGESSAQSFKAAFVPILDRRERQAPDDFIGLRYPIRAYQYCQSSRTPAPSVQLILSTQTNRGKEDVQLE